MSKRVHENEVGVYVLIAISQRRKVYRVARTDEMAELYKHKNYPGFRPVVNRQKLGQIFGSSREHLHRNEAEKEARRLIEEFETARSQRAKHGIQWVELHDLHYPRGAGKRRGCSRKAMKGVASVGSRENPMFEELVEA